MKKNTFKSAIALCSFILGMLMVQSCSSESESLLGSVPDDADIVATVNLVKLAQASDIQVEDGQIVFPKELSLIKDEIDTDALKMMGRIAGSVDLEAVVVFGYMQSKQGFATFLIKDVEELRSVLRKADMERDREDGVEFYSDGGSYGPCVVISSDEKQGWIVDRDKLSSIEDFEHARKKNNITRYSGLAEVLTADNILNLVVDGSKFNLGKKDGWLAMNLTVKNNAIVADAYGVTTDGETITTDDLRPVNTDFLRYMPANFITAFAIGLNPEGQWLKNIADGIGSFGRDIDSGLGMALPYLKAIDGTVAFGFGPKNMQALRKPDSPELWQGLVMAHMTQDKVNELTETLRSNLPGATSAGNGLYSFRSQGVEFEFGNVDGYFAAALGMDLKPDKQNPFTTVFEGKPMAFVFQTPMLNTIVDDPRFEFSIKATLEANDSKLTAKISLVGTEDHIIPTLFSALPEFAESYSRQLRGY